MAAIGNGGDAIMAKLTIMETELYNLLNSGITVDQNVNIDKVANVAVSTGHGVAAGTLRVELPTDGTGVVGLNTGSNIIGKIGIDQTTPGTTNLVQTKETPDATSTFSITPYSSTALEASKIVKASAGNLFGFVYSNTNAALRYVQLFNSTTLPADGTVPVLVFPVQANSVFTFDTGKFANYFTTGIVICNSTTLATKTIGAADSLFYVQYL